MSPVPPKWASDLIVALEAIHLSLSAPPQRITQGHGQSEDVVCLTVKEAALLREVVLSFVASAKERTL